jgi:NitT/TauT family transport system substrate-binding protein
MMNLTITRLGLLVSLLCVLIGCDRGDSTHSRTAAPTTAATGSTATPVKLTLDWKPEPEFGGFYAAREGKAFQRHGLDVDLRSAGEGAPTWQLVATGKTDFATTAADQVLIARASDADVVALFAVYQTAPQGVMTHAARGFNSLADVFAAPGTLAAENNTWLKFCMRKYAPVKVTVSGYGGGVAAFLAKSDYSQQCFVTSEPIVAKRQGATPETFLIADSGYNPYTTVLVTSGKTLKEKPGLVKAMAEACREGWRAYLTDPAPTNAVMGTLNKDMDVEAFAEGAKAQAPLIEPPAGQALGAMTKERWETLAGQLVELKVIDKAPAVAECFVNP